MMAGASGNPLRVADQREGSGEGRAEQARDAATTKEIATELAAGRVIPYLGPGVASLGSAAGSVPSTTEELAAALAGMVAVPHRLRGRLASSAQYIENFKHRRTLVDSMNKVFGGPASPTELHAWLATQSVPLVVDMWYDDAMPRALARRTDWGQVQGLSQAEHFGTWYGAYDPDGILVPDPPVEAWTTLLYKPIGGHWPASNYVVSDSDFVEVLTEIDIQTPIPRAVQRLREGRSFLFLGCRFNDQLPRAYARQIMKRSGQRHWAVLEDEPSRMEARFLAEQGIHRLPVALAEFVRSLVAAVRSACTTGA